ncbi:cytochrome P450 72A397-like [Silene latifolia]|uniref:cytochrome P450 72A397-like n=1 Tax=Silene latifolia TaxID=37657 RepID=UPI003D773040
MNLSQIKLFLNHQSSLMEVKPLIFGILITTSVILIWKAMKLFWLNPKKIERCLRKQGIKGNPYKPFLGDIKELVKLTKNSMLKPINFSDDTLPRILAFVHHTIQIHGKNCFAWVGPTPWLIVSDVDKIKEIFANYEDFRKPDQAMSKIVSVGLFTKEGDIWAKHRAIINPAFRMDKLKNVCGTMHESCSIMMNSWEEIAISKDGTSEIDVWPFLENLSGDLISRAAFGSSYQQGKIIFDLQREYMELALSLQATFYIPGWSYIPTKTNRRAKEIIRQIRETLTRMIESRKAEMEEGGNTKDDLLGILLESNMSEKGRGLTTYEVAQECQLFYLAGSETTSSLLAWTLILLSKHPIWQDRARAEVLQEFGKDGEPTFDGLNRLKTVTMILNEVLRLYPPGYMLMRKVYTDVQLKELLIPAGTEIVVPLCVVHQDSSLWGEDSKDFNPDRFAEGISEATKGQPIYFPFSMGPRICIGKNFALLEAKLVLTMILQRFSFELSPSYTHAPYAIMITKPQYGANLVLSKLYS